MTEVQTPYLAAKHIRVSPRWLPLVYRLASLQGGQVYTVTVIVPDKADDSPRWAITGNGKIENNK